MSKSPILVIGGGIAGLSVAYALRRRGQRVHMVSESTLGGVTSPLAAGMLAPVNELEFNEIELLHLGLAARAYYPQLALELGDIGLDKCGTLDVGLDPDDTGYLKRLFEYQTGQGMQVEWVGRDRLRELEPCLSSHISHGIWSPRDIQVDNRKLLAALAKTVRQGLDELREGWTVKALESSDEGWKLKMAEVQGEGEETAHFEQVVLATGTSQSLTALTPCRIYPVRGEMLSLRPDAEQFPLQKVVRIRNKVWGNAYLVPKGDRILLGSTSEEKGRRAVNTAGGMLDILRKCYTACPGIYELDLIETWSGLRPSTLSRQPLIGPVPGKTGLFVLNGLYRHGILLGPLAGELLAKLMHQGKIDERLKPFLPRKNQF